MDNQARDAGDANQLGLHITKFSSGHVGESSNYLHLAFRKPNLKLASLRVFLFCTPYLIICCRFADKLKTCISYLSLQYPRCDLLTGRSLLFWSILQVIVASLRPHCANMSS